MSHTGELRELPEERSFVAAAEAAVIRAGHAVTDMAYFTARDRRPAEYCERMVADANVFVGIIGLSYGSPARGRPDQSYTELEYEAATAIGLPRLVFMLRETTVGLSLDDQSPELHARQRNFRERLLNSSDVTVAMVAAPAELEIALFHALVDLRDGAQSRVERPQLSLSAVVVGLAVMDVVLEVPYFPTSDNQSVQVRQSTTHPGGKGLAQAVAARLLRMRTTLITPIATDVDAAILTNVLEKHDINTAFLPRRNSTDTASYSPKAYIVRTPTDDYTFAFKNELELPLRAEYLGSDAVARHIAASDIVFLTFEVSQEAIRQVVFDLVKSKANCLLAVTASPPRDDLRLDRTTLSRIDLLVGDDTEIRQLFHRNAMLDTRTVLQRLINDGVKNVVALSPVEIIAASRNLAQPIVINYPEFSTYDAAGARSAFAVCLAHQLRMNAGVLRAYDIAIASVAYGLSANRFGESDSMPTIDEVLAEAQHLNILEHS